MLTGCSRLPRSAGDTLAEAEAFKRRVDEQLALGDYRPTSTTTSATYAADWMRIKPSNQPRLDIGASLPRASPPTASGADRRSNWQPGVVAAEYRPCVVYDALAESVCLLEGAPPASEARLSRRVRHLPLALDRDDDVAATMFLRRGVSGVPELDVHTLELTDKGWRLLGGGGGPGEQTLSARPPSGDSEAPGQSHSGGGTARMSSRRLGWSQDNWVRWAELRLAQEVTVLRVDDRRLPVAAHGMAVVVWTKQAPAVTAVDSIGVVLGAVPVGRHHCVPVRYRDL